MSSIYYDRPYELVKTQMSDMAYRADSALFRANLAIDNLVKVEPFREGALPTPPGFEFDNPLVGKVDRPTSVDFGVVSAFTVPDIETINVDSANADAIPTFHSSIGSITLPAPPAAINLSDKPTRPTLNAIAIPGAPVINQPDLGDLVPIHIPTFTFPELPTFDGTAPTIGSLSVGRAGADVTTHPRPAAAPYRCDPPGDRPHLVGLSPSD